MNKLRIDIFPYENGSKTHYNMTSNYLSFWIKWCQTNEVEVVERKDDIVYVHYRNVLKNVDGEIVLHNQWRNSIASR